MDKGNPVLVARLPVQDSAQLRSDAYYCIQKPINRRVCLVGCVRVYAYTEGTRVPTRVLVYVLASMGAWYHSGRKYEGRLGFLFQYLL